MFEAGTESAFCPVILEMREGIQDRLPCNLPHRGGGLHGTQVVPVVANHRLPGLRPRPPRLSQPVLQRNIPDTPIVSTARGSWQRRAGHWLADALDLFKVANKPRRD